ncbi:MAG: hypothetical protein AAFU64_03560 [Bacteroidota bacterium]
MGFRDQGEARIFDCLIIERLDYTIQIFEKGKEEENQKVKVP